MKRRILLAANWKMHGLPKGWDDKKSPYRPHKDIEVVVFPTFLDVETCKKQGLHTGGQYGRSEQNGAFTGDINMDLLAAHGCKYVLCGHSERRKYHGETDADIAKQVVAALEVGLHPILCIGETAEERKAGEERSVIEKQMKPVLMELLKFKEASERAGLAGPARAGLHTGKRESVREKPLGFSFTIAYEPVWAISGGDPTKPACSPKDAQEMHTFIRSLLPVDVREETRILYGGSMKPENAAELLAQPDIDGGLVGGASLDPKAFRSIIDSCLKGLS